MADRLGGNAGAIGYEKYGAVHGMYYRPIRRLLPPSAARFLAVGSERSERGPIASYEPGAQQRNWWAQCVQELISSDRRKTACMLLFMINIAWFSSARMNFPSKLVRRALVVLSLLVANVLHAGDQGELVATAGLLSPNGSAGGGITSWAILSGYGSADSWGGAAQASTVALDDYQLTTLAISVAVNNRFEIFASRNELDLPSRLGVPFGSIAQKTIGAKVRLEGDLIYGDVPQISLSAYYQDHEDEPLLNALGGLRDSDTGVQLGVTRLWVDGLGHRTWLGHIGLRYDRATYLGLLGHGASGTSREISVEAAGAVFINRHLAIGAEYRQMPDVLPGIAEDDWKDVFIAWFPNKNVSVALAYVDAGEIVGLPSQNGVYVAVEVTQ